MYVCVCARVCVRVLACVRARVNLCVRVFVSTLKILNQLLQFFFFWRTYNIYKFHELIYVIDNIR